MIKNDNFIVIQGWMVAELGLKGNELLVYAIIHGFSQDGESRFTGSLRYLTEWTNSSKQGVQNSLKSLCEKGLICKTDKVLNGVKFCEYHANNLDGVCKKVGYPVQESCLGGMQKSCPNNIVLDNSNYSIEDIKDIVGYLNKRVSMNYKYTSKATQKHIRARFNEGFTVQDFFTVIDKKAEEWKGTSMEQYLRPETLFGSKFEGYLNAKQAAPKQQQNGGNIFLDMAKEEGVL